MRCLDSNELLPGFLPNSVLPLDLGGTNDGYLYCSDGTNYNLLSHLSPAGW